jgi:hypothetical protein
MKYRAVTLLAALSLTRLASAQDAEQPDRELKFGLKGDALVRQEWTREIPDDTEPSGFKNEQRRRLQLRPRLDVGVSGLKFGVGGEFNFSSDTNVTSPRPALIRDNYDSKDARLDLAFGSFKPVSWFQAQGGRFVMPVGLTELIWDRDLRPQGGAVTLEARDLGSVSRLGATVLLAKGSHVFDDSATRLLLLSGTLAITTGPESRFQLTGSYLKFTRLEALEPMIRRQNSRPAAAPAPAPLAFDYKVVDIVARLTRTGKVSSQLVADYCWNTAISEGNKGLWLAVVLGSIETAGGRLEYTFGRVDKDATVAAYATDDFFWATGWQGHRLDLGLRASDHSSIHAVGQLQKFKDSPIVEQRDQSVKRFRLEMRLRL